MNKGDLIDSVASAANMSKADAGRAVDAVLGSVSSTLASGGFSFFSGIWYILC